MRAELLGGVLVLSGKIDLLLGAPDRLEPMRGTRLAIDLKTGGAYPSYVEDNRFYALLLTLASASRPIASRRCSSRAGPGRPRTSPRSCSSTRPSG